MSVVNNPFLDSVVTYETKANSIYQLKQQAKDVVGKINNVLQKLSGQDSELGQNLKQLSDILNKLNSQQNGQQVKPGIPDSELVTFKACLEWIVEYRQVPQNDELATQISLGQVVDEAFAIGCNQWIDAQNNIVLGHQEDIKYNSKTEGIPCYLWTTYDLDAADGKQWGILFAERIKYISENNGKIEFIFEKIVPDVDDIAKSVEIMQSLRESKQNMIDHDFCEQFQKLMFQSYPKYKRDDILGRGFFTLFELAYLLTDNRVKFSIRSADLSACLLQKLNGLKKLNSPTIYFSAAAASLFINNFRQLDNVSIFSELMTASTVCSTLNIIVQAYEYHKSNMYKKYNNLISMFKSRTDPQWPE